MVATPVTPENYSNQFSGYKDAWIFVIQLSRCMFKATVRKSPNFGIHLSVIWGGHSSVTPVIFSIEMHFGPYVLQNWNLTKSVQSISLKWRAELLWLHCTGCVSYCGLSSFSYNSIFFLAAEMWPLLLVFIRPAAWCFFAWVLIPVTHFTSQLLCLCSR